MPPFADQEFDADLVTNSDPHGMLLQEASARLNISFGQARNLLTLSQYLGSLPGDYRHFDMGVFYDGSAANPSSIEGKISSECGAIACAVGHGPDAGIMAADGEDWLDYSSRVFGLSTSGSAEEDAGWDWCFSEEWKTLDNTPHGASRRIMYLLREGPQNPSKFASLFYGETCHSFPSFWNVVQCVLEEYEDLYDEEAEARGQKLRAFYADYHA